MCVWIQCVTVTPGNVHLDHLTVPCRNKDASAKLLADLFQVPWKAEAGPFSAVYMSDGLTIDFDETDEPYPVREMLTVSYARQPG